MYLSNQGFSGAISDIFGGGPNSPANVLTNPELDIPTGPTSGPYIPDAIVASSQPIDTAGDANRGGSTWADVAGEVVRGIIPGVGRWVEQELGVNQPQVQTGVNAQGQPINAQGQIIQQPVMMPAAQPKEKEENPAWMIGVYVVGGLLAAKAFKLF